MRRREFTTGLTALTLLTACSNANTLVIGVAAPMSGSQAVQGEYIKDAVQLAVDEINKKGGIGGKTIEVSVEDDQARPQDATQVARKLASDDRVLGVIGHFNSGCSIPASSIYSQSKLAMLTPGSTNITLTEQGYKNVFRLVGRDDQQAAIDSEFALKKLKSKVIAILHDNTPYGKGLASAFQQGVEKGGAKVVIFEAITSGDKDFRAVLTKIKNLNPDTIFFGGVFVEGGLVASQARELGINSRFISGDGSKENSFIEIVGKASNEMYISGPAQVDNKAFVDAYKAAYGKDPGPFSPYAYDATRVLLDAIAKSGTPTRETVLEALHKVKDFAGLAGGITFDEKGDVVKAPFDIFTIKDGQFVPYKA
jgi:branched-chain amino acid transport system substrate-binding protein